MPPRRRTGVLDHVVASFAGLKDPRIDRRKRHSLVNVLVMTLSATIANAEGWDDIADFCESRRKWFESFLDLPNGTPSADRSAASSSGWIRRHSSGASQRSLPRSPEP
jgi:hypothetical protein